MEVLAKEIILALDWCQEHNMSIHFHDGGVTIKWLGHTVGQGESFVLVVQEAQKIKYKIALYDEDGNLIEEHLYRKE